YMEYNPDANTDDGSCATLVVEGCTDSSYMEYNPDANTDDGSCATLVVEGCTDSSYMEYNPDANTDDGSCATLVVAGCSSIEFDGYTYSVVEIGDQCWFAENLRTTAYANGDSIPTGLTDSEWTTTTAGATAVYGEGSSSCDSFSPDIDACDEAQSLAEYGRLYNWYAVDDARGLCPTGWHVPTDEEWTELEGYISSQGFDGSEGTALRSTTGWNVVFPEAFPEGTNFNGSDNFGFSALPSGARTSFDGTYNLAGLGAYFWTSTYDVDPPWPDLGPLEVRLATDIVFYAYNFENDGSAVRCLKDSE
ncbi:MAG: fibrobacter succinogenes major paralogous domain-containing protein, partial [Flavobacteriales bacterium]